MPELADLRAGVYRHYKGPLYLVLGYSHNASNENRPQVLYLGLQLEAAKAGPRFATRDADDFSGLVCVHREHFGLDWDSSEHKAAPATSHLADHCRARFTYLGPVYYAGMEGGGA